MTSAIPTLLSHHRCWSRSPSAIPAGSMSLTRSGFGGLRVLLTSSRRAAMSTLSESKEIHVRDDVLKRLNDPSLLHTESYIGGSWVNAADDDRVEVRGRCVIGGSVWKCCRGCGSHTR